MTAAINRAALTALWDMMPTPLLAFGAQGEVTYANKAAKSRPGHPVQSMGGKAVIRSLVRDVAQGKVKLPYAIQVELAGNAKVAGQFMASPSGFELVLLLLQDAPAQTPAQSWELSDIMALLRDEIEPPMRALGSALGQLEESHQSAQVEVAVDQLKQRLGRLTDLVAVFGNDVLVTDDRVDLAEAIRQVCMKLAPAAIAKRVRIALDDVRDGLPPLYGNAKLIQRALHECFEHAIGNARRAVSASQDVEVSIGCMLTGEHVLISVRNQGALPDDAKGVETIDAWAPRKADSGAAAEGRLGLPLVRRIVGLHGGNMRISAVGDDEVRVLMEFPTGAPVRGQMQLNIAQAQRYAADLAQLMSRRKKETR